MTVDRLFIPSESSKLTGIGRALAVAGHVVAASPWLYTVSIFIRHTAPDSIFIAAFLAGVLESLLFITCMTLGFSLRRISPHIAKGIISGWLGGLLAIPCGGTVVVGFLAALI